MKVKYTVSVGGYNFEFKDGMTSIGIAELLVNNFVPTKYITNTDLTVVVTVKKTDDEAEEDEDAGRTDEEADEADD